MTTELLHLLRQVDTPTVCNAIEVVEGRRGFANFTRRTMLSSDPIASAMVGFARTASIAAALPSTEYPATLRERRKAYYRHMAEAPETSIAVIEDEDGDDAVGAFWGEINVTVHKAFGLQGTLTNGVMRDLGDLPTGYPVIAGRIGPSHAFVRVESIGKPVKIFGMTVQDGDLIHADRHGALVIPPEAIGNLENAIHKLRETELLILGPARERGFDLEAFNIAWENFEAART